jgi:hypothetical protein
VGTGGKAAELVPRSRIRGFIQSFPHTSKAAFPLVQLRGLRHASTQEDGQRDAHASCRCKLRVASTSFPLVRTALAACF